MAKETVTLYIRLPAELLAKIDERSIDAPSRNGYVVSLLERAMDKPEPKR